ncbi:leucine-rich repeat domain-containing protein [Treponema pedis]|uniref:leucine-rich repeat domain-containing protein n=1 Tax=Treponema pedis TaxID=409322 RepID=UPI000411D40C|nr:leucine-rich repeat domain-containing protein [Treponema pedis]
MKRLLNVRIRELKTPILVGSVLTIVFIVTGFFSGCPNTSGRKPTGSTGGNNTPAVTPGPYVKVPYADLETYLRDTASIEKLNYIEVTGPIPKEAFKGSGGNPGDLGQKLKDHSDKKVALKIAAYPAGLTSMENCFADCTGLTTAPAIPAGVTDMGWCFYGCKNLTTAPDIPAGVTVMSGCFAGCKNLTRAPAIPKDVTDMSYCFADCTSLTTVPDIPASVTDMGYCFYACTKLTGVTLNCNYSAGKFDSAFTNCGNLADGSIKVPQDQLDKYKAGAGDMGTAKEKFAAIP